MPPWISAILSIASVLIAIVSFAKSVSNAKKVDHRSDYDQLYKMATEWNEQGYFVRMWRLEMFTRPHDFCSLNAFKPALRKKYELGTHPEVQQLWRDALSLDYNSPRADMLSIFHFALKLDAWLKRHGCKKYKDADLVLLVRVFGPNILNGLLAHDLYACRLFNPHGKGAAYYPTSYGLFDPCYRSLVEKLLEFSTNEYPGSHESAREDHRRIVEYLDTLKNPVNTQGLNAADTEIEQPAGEPLPAQEATM